MAEVPQHLLSGEQVTPDVFENISETAIRLQKPLELRRARKEIMKHHELGAAALALFVEPSARTRYSSLRACARLDVPAFQEAEPERTLSLLKGESWEDTFLTFDALGYELIFFRSNQEGDAQKAAENVRSSIIVNCGDGGNQHPTQAILDAHTLKTTFGNLDGLTLAYVGDPMKARTAHSLIDLLSNYDTHHIFATHPEMGLTADYEARLREKGVSFEVMHSITEASKKAEVIYMNRNQVERLPRKKGESKKKHEKRKAAKKQAYLAETVINPDSKVLRIIEERGVRIMHPLPRNEELPVELTHHPAGLFIDQMEEGVNTRTATSYLQLVGELFDKVIEISPVYVQAA